MTYFNYTRISTKEERRKQKYKWQGKTMDVYAKENNLIFAVSYREDISG